GPMTPAERLRTRRCIVPADNEFPNELQTGSGVELFIDLPETTVDPEIGKGPDKLARVLLNTLTDVVPAAESPRRPQGALAWYHLLFFPLRICLLVMLHGVML